MHELTEQQRAVVDHEGGPMRVVGGFGTGKTAALVARVGALVAGGRSVLELRGDFVAFAAELLARHGPRRRVLPNEEQERVVRRLLAAEGAAQWPLLHGELRDPSFAREVARTVQRYQASFLGEEELFVHAEAAGELGQWEELARFTRRYLDALHDEGAVDGAGALVGASLVLRSPDVLAGERSRFDAIVVDDYQNAMFAMARLLVQLAGPGGDVTVAGNPDAAIGSSAGCAGKHLDELGRRFGVDPANDVVLAEPLRRPAPPALRIVDEDGSDAVVAAVLRSRPDAEVVTRETVAAAVGREWATVVVTGASDGRWPAPRPRHRWFDHHLLGGPDVPQDDERDAAWRAEERRRFAIACSRATAQTIVVAEPPVTTFVADLLG
ncbi:MAG TPA: UvrD-helicase domain-containing protein [Acidimicrobiales bacterium]